MIVLSGVVKRIRSPLGIAPINGPKNGIIFVIPITTLIRTEYVFIFSSSIPINARTPIIRESIALPDKKLMKV
jgi:hypothetical protein